MSSYAQSPRVAFANDAVLAAAFVLVAFTHGTLGALAPVLLASIAAALAWGAITLHHPRKVTVDEDGMRVSRHGREHFFAWKDVTDLKVRRFVVKDRVLVRVTPSPAWRGRYWLVDGPRTRGFEETVVALERVSRSLRPEDTSSDRSGSRSSRRCTTA